MKFVPKIELDHEDTKAIRDLVVQAIKSDSEKVMDNENPKVWQSFMSDVTRMCDSLANKAFKEGFNAGLKYKDDSNISK